MRWLWLALVLAVGAAGMQPARAAPCLMVTLTGTQSGPAVYNGIAGAGTLVRYGDASNNCGTVRLQFDVGRGTLLRLSQAAVLPEQLTAVFFTREQNR
jgi:ribonuclease Z